MDQGGIALNALLREREWKTSNCAVFMRVWAERTFTRVRRVARVSPDTDCVLRRFKRAVLNRLFFG
jgi:hypothetical protein